MIDVRFTEPPKEYSYEDEAAFRRALAAYLLSEGGSLNLDKLNVDSIGGSTPGSQPTLPPTPGSIVDYTPFASNIRPIKLYASNPVSGEFVDQIIFNTTDKKLYKWTGSAWDAVVNTVDLVGQVDTTQIADAAITAAKIGAAAVQTGNLALGAVDAASIATGAVITAKLADLAVTTAKINDAAITAAKIGAAAVQTGNIAAGAVDTTKLNVLIGGDNLVSDSGFERNDNGVWNVYSNGEVATLTFPTTAPYRGSRHARVVWGSTNGSTKGVYASPGWVAGRSYVVSWYAKAASPIATGMALYWNFFPQASVALSNPNLSTVYQRYAYRITMNATNSDSLYISITNGFGAAANTLDIDCVQVEEGDTLTAWSPRPDEILPSTITTTEIADNAITTAKLVAGAVVAGKIAANTITAAQIAALTITAAEIAAGTITAAKIASHTITAAEIAAGTITATEIAANTITAAQIAAATITATEIAAGSIGASRLAVGFAPGAALNNDPAPTDLAAWVFIGGNAGTIQTVTDGKVGNTVLRSSTTTEYITNAVPYDPTKSYRVRGWVRNPTGANGTLYLGVGVRKYDGSFANGSGYDYIAASAVSVPSSFSWFEYVGVLAPNIGSYTNPRTIELVVLLNYGGTLGYLEAQDIRLEEILPGTLIQDGVITTAKLNAGAVTAAKIASHTITAAEIAAGTITATEIAASTITAGQIAALTITAAQIAANTITAAKIAANTITASQIAAGTITATEIAADTITAGQIAAGAINTSELAANAVTAGKIASHTITAAEIAAGTITATEIAANTITASKIAAGTITATEIAAGAITASKISAGTITADKLVINGVDLGTYGFQPITIASTAASGSASDGSVWMQYT